MPSCYVGNRLGIEALLRTKFTPVPKKLGIVFGDRCRNCVVPRTRNAIAKMFPAKMLAAWIRTTRDARRNIY